jgi:deazaflavin-dependent oxidoreductase (nitroreductase family)
MTVELTPGGTRGTEFPRFPAPIMRAVGAVAEAIYRRRGSRMRVANLPLLLLTTVGSTTGLERRVLLGFLEADDGWLVIASAGGSAHHPGWYFNMARNPDRVWVELDRRKIRVRPESLRGMEREAAWKRIVAVAPRYRSYEQKTDRVIPVVRLTPVE